MIFLVFIDMFQIFEIYVLLSSARCHAISKHDVWTERLHLVAGLLYGGQLSQRGLRGTPGQFGFAWLGKQFFFLPMPSMYVVFNCLTSVSSALTLSKTLAVFADRASHGTAP